MLFQPISKEEKHLIFVYTTCATRAEAREIAFAAIDQKLAVCCDYWPIESIYPWQGVVEDIEQYMLVLTTRRDLAEKLRASIKALHSYEVPVISESGARITNPDYTFWADATLDDARGYMSPEEKKKKDEFDAEGNFHPGQLK